MAIRILAADPLWAVWVNGVNCLNGFRPGVSFFYMFHAPDGLAPLDSAEDELSPAIANLDRPEILITTILLCLFSRILFLLAAAGLIRLVWKRAWRILLLLAFPCAVLLYAPGISSYALFRIPVEPVLCLLAAATLSELLPRLIARFKPGSPAISTT